MEQTMGRRAVLSAGCGAACALALSGCATYGPSGPVTAQAPASRAPAAPVPAGSAAGGPAGGAPALVATADVPVGGGVVVADQQIVVTQPVAGTFKAFSAVCTHQGCVVNAVAGGTINCPCHGSRFSVTDGAPTAGPAKKPLPEKAVTVQGSGLVLA